MKKKKFEIQKQRILPGFESGVYEARRHYDRSEFSGLAHDGLKRDNRVSVRISGSDLSILQQHALKQGIPTQSLLANIIHEYATGDISESSLNREPDQEYRQGAADPSQYRAITKDK